MDPYQAQSGPNKTFVFILGLIIGAIIVGGGIFAYSTFFPKEDKSEFKVTPVKEFTLHISNPPDGETVSKEEITISGSTGTKSIIVINGGKEDVIVETSNGAFSVNYNLELGENPLTITAYEEETGDSRTNIVNVLYLTEDLEIL
ncbi:hypothetical protein IID23_02420 [Patescibacteria group bacterium]|nr:hypothetical protein [Patescibacteria group bacterium]